MIAVVGGIVNVSGSRMATPLAPPRPGSTPMQDAEQDADHHVAAELIGVSSDVEAVHQRKNASN